MLKKYDLLQEYVNVEKFPYNLAWDVIRAGERVENTRLAKDRAHIVARVNLAVFLERVSSLRQPDFELLCEHYMNGKSYQEIGKEIGKTAEEVEKQVAGAFKELLEFHHLYWTPTYNELVQCKDKLATVSAKYRALRKTVMTETVDGNSQKPVSPNRILIEELGLPMRIVLLLRRANLYTVRDILKAAHGKLLNAHGIGKVTLDAVSEACAEYGISLKKGMPEETMQNDEQGTVSVCQIVCNEEKLQEKLEQKRAEGYTEEELEQYRKDYLENFRKGVFDTLSNVVHDGLLDAARAAAMAGMSQEEFLKELNE